MLEGEGSTADAYASAGAVASESLSSIRTVTACGGHRTEVKRYSKFLSIAERIEMKHGISSGLSMGLTWLVMPCCFGVGLWYGTELVAAERDDGCAIGDSDGCFSGGDVLLVFFSVLIGVCVMPVNSS